MVIRIQIQGNWQEKISTIWNRVSNERTRRSLVAFAWAMMLIAVCGGRGADAQTGWKLAWNDEFDGNAGAPPAAQNWKFESGPGRQVGGNEEAETYCAYGEDQPPCVAKTPNAYLDGRGHLVLVAERTGGRVVIPGKGMTVPLYTSARLDSRSSFQYGRIEASIRVPTGQGVWPAFWVLGEQTDSLRWPAVGEIDIMESWNPQAGSARIDPTLNHASVHGPVKPGSPEGYVDITGIYSFPQPMQSGFHQFAAEWSPGEVDFFCDGVLYSRQSVGSLHEEQVWALDRQPFHLLLNLAMGGGFFGYPDASTEKYPTMVVDYVRVYQRDEALLPAGWGNADIGGPEVAGSSSYREGVWEVKGSGVGIAGHADQFQYLYHAIAGDGEISAHLLSQSSHLAQARAGVVFRGGRAAGARFVFLGTSPDGSIHFRVRDAEGELPEDSVITEKGSYFKLRRQGDLVLAFLSENGEVWKQVAQTAIHLPEDTLAGLASTARDNGAPNQARFDYVNVSRSDAAWDGAPVSLPGTIQAELFNTGGQGYSYAASMRHSGPQELRPAEGPAIAAIRLEKNFPEQPGGYFLTGLRKNDYLNYAVLIEREGDYVLSIRTAAKGPGGAIHFNLDQKPITGALQIADTGGAENWRLIESGVMHLPAGRHTLALVVDEVGAQGVAGNVDLFTVRTR